MADFSLLDSANPVLALIDRMLVASSLAPVWRIAVFAALASALSMLLYKKLSNQAELAAVKSAVQQVQADLARANQSDLGRLLRQNLSLTGRQLWLSFWPALLASIPILFVLVFCSNQYGVQSISAGERVYVKPAELQDALAGFVWDGVNAQWDARKQAWTFYHPEPGRHASLSFDEHVQLRIPTSVPTVILHKREWWNLLIANPAGYLDDDARMSSVTINAPSARIIDWGPKWMRGWLFAFTLFLVGFSIAIKILWKIH